MHRRAEIGVVVAVRASDDGLGLGEGREEQENEKSEYGETGSHSQMVALASN